MKINSKNILLLLLVLIFLYILFYNIFFINSSNSIEGLDTSNNEVDTSNNKYILNEIMIKQT